MKRRVLTLLKCLLGLFSFPFLYFLVALLFSVIPVNPNQNTPSEKSNIIYINTNGVHLDIIIPTSLIQTKLAEDLTTNKNNEYLSFGWGDYDFYLNTPNWADLTLQTALKAMFLKSETLLHVTRFNQKQTGWIQINITDNQLTQLQSYLFNSFKLKCGLKVKLNGKGYHNNDDFYLANGSYSCIKTCNTWVNNAFKASQMKACFWTPFDFGLINLYQ